MSLGIGRRPGAPPSPIRLGHAARASQPEARRSILRSAERVRKGSSAARLQAALRDDRADVENDTHAVPLAAE